MPPTRRSSARSHPSSTTSHHAPSPTSPTSSRHPSPTSPTAPTHTNAPSLPPPAFPPHPTFPPHAHPRAWLITATHTPIGQSVARHALRHGDNVVGCVNLTGMRGVAGGEEVVGRWEGFEEEIEMGEMGGMGGMDVKTEVGKEGEDGEGESQREEEEEKSGNGNGKKEGGGGGGNGKREGKAMTPWKQRWKRVMLDGRSVGQCQAAVAEAQASFEGGGVDVLFCCDGEALIGTVEELAASPRTQSLVREQFETNFYGPVNCIKAVLPSMRKKGGGHIIVLSSITNHLGTPCLGTTCASGWALDGFCDSLAYEVAPFNIKVSIVQPSMEVGLLTHKITAVPQLDQYSPDMNAAPFSREIVGGLLDRIEGRDGRRGYGKLMSPDIECLYPRLPGEMTESLIAETVHAVLAIGGHDNPPARHIVGFEGIASVKEKLKTVSEELEDFVGVSCAVDIESDDQGLNGHNGSLNGAH